jgi:hypothetical protein
MKSCCKKLPAKVLGGQLVWHGIVPFNLDAAIRFTR